MTATTLVTQKDFMCMRCHNEPMKTNGYCGMCVVDAIRESEKYWLEQMKQVKRCFVCKRHTAFVRCVDCNKTICDDHSTGFEVYLCPLCLDKRLAKMDRKYCVLCTRQCFHVSRYDCIKPKNKCCIVCYRALPETMKERWLQI